MFDFPFEIYYLDISYHSCSHELQIFYETKTFIYSHKKLCNDFEIGSLVGNW